MCMAYVCVCVFVHTGSQKEGARKKNDSNKDKLIFNKNL